VAGVAECAGRWGAFHIRLGLHELYDESQTLEHLDHHMLLLELGQELLHDLSGSQCRQPVLALIDPLILRRDHPLFHQSRHTFVAVSDDSKKDPSTDLVLGVSLPLDCIPRLLLSL